MAAGKARPRRERVNPEPVGSPAWLARVFATTVVDDLFAGHTPGRGDPLLVLLGGQPAAGKTQAQAAILAECAADDLVEITGDDLREYHPDYARLAEQSPFAMPGVTAPVSGGLIGLALDHALTQRHSVLLEGTFRDKEMVIATATRFADAGYRVMIVAVATPAPVSRLSTEMRSLDAGYPEVGRWTPPDAHESALAGSAMVVSALEALPFVGRVQVFSREALLFDNSRTDTGECAQPARAARILRQEQHRQLSVREAYFWLQDYAAVFATARARPGYFASETAPTYLRLQNDAQNMIHILSKKPGAPLSQLSREQRVRAAILERVLPPESLPEPHKSGMRSQRSQPHPSSRPDPPVPRL